MKYFDAKPALVMKLLTSSKNHEGFVLEKGHVARCKRADCIDCIGMKKRSWHVAMHKLIRHPEINSSGYDGGYKQIDHS